MGYTMAEKILMKNTGLSHLAPGDLIMTRPDMCMVHDIYTPFVVQKLDEMKFRRLADPEKAVIFLDHLCPTNQATGDPRHYHKGHELSDRFGIRKLHAGEGISHTLMHEYRYALPGTVVVATDSHTPTYGGGGCFCTGIGYTEMAATLGSGEMWMKVPEAIRITVEGELPAGVYAKDIVLQVLKDLRSDGGTYKSLEYVGSTIDALDMSGRYTIANMSLEAGCKTALFAADQKTAEAHAGVHLDVGLGHGGAVLRQGVEGQARVHGGDGAHHVQVDELLQLRPVHGGAEHQNLLLHKARPAQGGGLGGLADGEAADALGPEQLGHLGDAGAPGVSREDAVDGGPSGTALHHPDVLLYGRLLNDQHPHGTAPFFSLLGRREIRLPPV